MLLHILGQIRQILRVNLGQVKQIEQRTYMYTASYTLSS